MAGYGKKKGMMGRSKSGGTKKPMQMKSSIRRNMRKKY